VYNCYAQGVLKMEEVDADEYSAYVTYDGRTWLLEDETKEIPESYKVKDKIHSCGQCFWSVDYTTNLYELLGGVIYASDENKDVIYVKTISDVKYEKGIWKCVAE